jgi:type I restriction enzyme S subunit
MVVKKGYKQTEVGVIPEDWTLTIVRDFAKIITGPFGTLLKASEYSGGNGVPLISVGEIREGYLSVTYETPRVSSDVTRRLPQYVLKEGDIIFGRKGGVDRSALIRQNQVGWFLGSDGIALRPFGRLCQEYASLQFQSKRVQSWLLQHAIGTTMPSLNQTILNNVIIPLPPTLAEQESIAGALSDADAWIESLEQLIAKKRQIKQGAMQELLTGKRRLPGFSGEWETKRLGELGITVAGLTYAPRAVAESGTLVLRASNVVAGTLVFIDNVFVKTDLPERVFVKTGDILICVRNGSRDLIGKCAKIPQQSETDRHVFGAFMCVYRTDFHDFVFHQFQSNVIKRQITEHLGATINQITNKSLNSFEIPIPEIPEQTAIATVLSDMDTEIESLESKLAKAREIKHGMMQELLTGRIRLI